MNLLQITATSGVLRTLRDVAGLEPYAPTGEDAGDGRYRIAAYGPDSVIPELEARGCEVRVLMSAAEVDDFHQRVALDVTLPPGFAPEA